MRSEITTELFRYDEVAVSVYDNAAITDEMLHAIEAEFRHQFDGVTGVRLKIDRDGNGWASFKFMTGLTEAQRERCENVLDQRLPDATVARWEAVKVVTQLTNEVLFHKSKRPVIDAEPDTLSLRAPNIGVN